MYTKFQVDWTSTSSKTILTKNFGLKWDRQTKEQTDEPIQRPENNNAHKWGIKNKHDIL